MPAAMRLEVRTGDRILTAMERDANKPSPKAPAEDASERTRQEEELLDELGRESFPASDPPSTWAGEDPIATGDEDVGT